MKYIDADRLRAEIEKKRKHLEIISQGSGLTEYDYGRLDAFRLVDSIIDFLQQESEVNLAKEIDNEWKKCNPTDEGMGVETANIHIEAFDIIARHFYEFGLKAKEEIK